MNKLFLFILIATFGTGATLYSQTGKFARHDDKDFSFGIKAGISIATLGGDIEYTEVKIGNTIGMFGMVKLGDNIGVSVDLLYSQQGCNFDSAKVDSSDYKLRYFNMPLLVNWYVPWAEGLSVKGGVQLGLLLLAEAKTVGVVTDAADSFISTDISIPLGISYELAFGLLLDVRYNIGVSNIWNNKNNVSGEPNKSIKNSAFQVTVGYRF